MSRHVKQQSCNNFNVQMVLLSLESRTTQWCHPVRRVRAQVLTIQINQLSKLSLHFEHLLFTVCLNENRAAVIIYYRVSIPSGINLDHCSKHPAIRKIEKQNNFSLKGNEGLNLQTCPCNLNLVADGHTNNLSHHGVMLFSWVFLGLTQGCTVTKQHLGHISWICAPIPVPQPNVLPKENFFKTFLLL